MHYNSSGVASKLIASTRNAWTFLRAGMSFMRVTHDFIASVRDVICYQYCNSYWCCKSSEPKSLYNKHDKLFVSSGKHNTKFMLPPPTLTCAQFQQKLFTVG